MRMPVVLEHRLDRPCPVRCSSFLSCSSGQLTMWIKQICHFCPCPSRMNLSVFVTTKLRMDHVTSPILNLNSFSFVLGLPHSNYIHLPGQPASKRRRATPELKWGLPWDCGLTWHVWDIMRLKGLAGIKVQACHDASSQQWIHVLWSLGRYFDVGKCLLLVDMDGYCILISWYRHLLLCELMKAFDQRRARWEAELVRRSVANFLNAAHRSSFVEEPRLHRFRLLTNEFLSNPPLSTWAFMLLMQKILNCGVCHRCCTPRKQHLGTCRWMMSKVRQFHPQLFEWNFSW